MDYTLCCNSLKCRVQLVEQAVVTTCSHIFCNACADLKGLSSTIGGQRECPACRTSLPNPDDVVSTQLNPTEDYKTSVLSGLGPTTIMECAGRGLAFWSYQATQEIIYQQHLAKTLTEKYNNLNAEVNKIINEANAEIDKLAQKMNQMDLEQESLKVENTNLANALREKTRKHQQTQDLYDRLKRKEMTAATQSAAYESVDEALNYASRGEAHLRTGHHATEDAAAELANQLGGHRRDGSSSSGGQRRMMPPPLPPVNRAAPSSFASQGYRLQQVNATPQHRTRLGTAPLGGSNIPTSTRPYNTFVSNVLGSSHSSRERFGPSSGRTVGKSGLSYGLSAGMRKPSHQEYESHGVHR